MIVNDTVVKEEAIIDLNRINYKQLYPYFFITESFLLICILSFLLLKNYYMIIFNAIIMIVFPFFHFSTIKNSIKYNVKITKLPINGKYSFNDNIFKYEIIMQDSKVVGETKADSINKVTETGKYFFISINNAGTYIIDKSGFTEGTSEDLRNFLYSNLSNFKNYKIDFKV